MVLHQILTGNILLKFLGKNAVLMFSYLGFKTVEVPLNGENVVNVSLEVGGEALDEVVITAFGFEKKTKSIGYSITQVKGEELNRVKTTSPLQALRGKVAGVNISNSSTGIKGSARVVIRGNSSFNGNNQPLYIIDGISLQNNSLVLLVSGVEVIMVTGFQLLTLMILNLLVF